MLTNFANLCPSRLFWTVIILMMIMIRHTMMRYDSRDKDNNNDMTMIQRMMTMLNLMVAMIITMLIMKMIMMAVVML